MRTELFSFPGFPLSPFIQNNSWSYSMCPIKSPAHCSLAGEVLLEVCQVKSLAARHTSHCHQMSDTRNNLVLCRLRGTLPSRASKQERSSGYNGCEKHQPKSFQILFWWRLSLKAFRTGWQIKRKKSWVVWKELNDKGKESSNEFKKKHLILL